jgi:hypothetical protein
MEDPVDHFVNVQKLPEDFIIPPKFQNRIEFDAEAHKLIFHGYMSKTEFDHLSSISQDWRFRRTLEDLFRQCIPDSKPTHGGFGRVLANFGQLFSRR